MTSDRAVRGGSWYRGSPTNLAASARFGYAPSCRGYNQGFRCARTTQQTVVRVNRGGSWYYVATPCRAAFRCFFASERRVINFGFRVIRRKT